jgi:hypothetical protein
MSLSSIGLALNSSSEGPGSTLDSILGWLLSKRPSVGLMPKKIFFLAQLVER